MQNQYKFITNFLLGNKVDTKMTKK